MRSHVKERRVKSVAKILRINMTHGTIRREPVRKSVQAMKVHLRLHGGLGHDLLAPPDEGAKQVVPEGTSIGALLEKRGIPANKIGVVIVNGSLVKTDHVLNDRDDAQLYPLLRRGLEKDHTAQTS
jgi:sulfur carrier protein ThiS